MATNIVVPDLGESVVEATVLRWLKQEGEKVGTGENLVELETEKVNLDIGAERSGVLSRILKPAGQNVKPGDVLGEIQPETVGEAPKDNPPTAATELAKTNKVSEEPARTTTHPPADGNKPDESPELAPVSTSKTIEQPPRATPVARRVAEEYGVDLAQLPAAPDRRITKQDVEGYIEQQKTEPQAIVSTFGSRKEERVKLSRRRQTIARRLVESQHNAAMLTTFNEVDMGAVMELRQRRKEAFKSRYGVGLGITSFFVRATVGALRDWPRLNAEIQGDEMILKHYYDIGIAVGAEEGLVVPVLRDADRMTFSQIEQAIDGFAKKAQSRTLTLDDLRGGTFTITNGGVFGSLLSTPILNGTQVGILGLHKIEDRPIARDGQVLVRPMMYVALSYDHRLVDGREAVQFLVRIKQLVEDPEALLLES